MRRRTGRATLGAMIARWTPIGSASSIVEQTASIRFLTLVEQWRAVYGPWFQRLDDPARSIVETL